MKRLSAVPIGVIESNDWGAPLTARELDATRGGLPPLIGWFAAALAVSVVVGAVDRILFGGCTCR